MSTKETRSKSSDTLTTSAAVWGGHPGPRRTKNVIYIFLDFLKNYFLVRGSVCSEPEEKGEDDTWSGIKADYPPDLPLYLHLFRLVSCGLGNGLFL